MDLERLLLRAMFPIAPNPLRVLQRASLSTPPRPWRYDVLPAPPTRHKNPDEPPLEAHWRLTLLPGGPTTSSTPSRLGWGPGLRWRLRDPSPSAEGRTTARLARQERAGVGLGARGSVTSGDCRRVGFFLVFNSLPFRWTLRHSPGIRLAALLLLRLFAR